MVDFLMGLVFIPIGIAFVLVMMNLPKWLYKKPKRTIKVEATVLNKDTFSKEIYSHHAPPKTVHYYYITFDCAGTIKKFETSFWLYDSVNINDKGVLEFWGDTVYSFK